MNRSAKAAGFTLIEIAVVLVVVGLLLSGAMVGLKPVIESSKTATTASRMDRIELAMLAYVMQNGCLPCPAEGNLATTSVNAGWSHSSANFYGPNGPTSQPCASPTGTSCNTNGGAAALRPTGVVPWNTLGLREADIIDGWNSRISYAVDASLTLTAGTSMTRTLPATYPAGAVSVTNYDATASQTAAAAYVLVSHGRDREGAFSSNGSVFASGVAYGAGTAQGANMPANNPATAPVGTPTGAFRQDTLHLIEGAATYFDDIVRYETAPSIIRNCGPNACGNPSG